jgi:hypothetical protein
MSQSRSIEEIYEEDVRPLLDQIDEGTFRSLDLEPHLGYESNFIGRVLSRASKNDKYELERIRRNPGVYALEQTEDRDPQADLSPEEGELLDKVMGYLKEVSDNQVTERELENTLLDDLGSIDASNMSKIGSVKDYLKSEKDEVNYHPEESVFKLED